MSGARRMRIVSLRLAYHIDKTLWNERIKAFSDCQYFPVASERQRNILSCSTPA